VAETTEVAKAQCNDVSEKNLTGHLESAVQEVFTTMVGEKLESAGPSTPLGLPNLTALVGLAGSMNGVVSVRCEVQTARLVAARMLGLADAEALVADGEASDDSAADAMGEICNMVAGAFKTRACSGGGRCLLSVPSVIIGADYHLRLLSVSNKMELRFILAGRPIWISLERRQ
jgi:chemotaxis protein CheX